MPQWLHRQLKVQERCGPRPESTLVRQDKAWIGFGTAGRNRSAIFPREAYSGVPETFCLSSPSQTNGNAKKGKCVSDDRKSPAMFEALRQQEPATPASTRSSRLRCLSTRLGSSLLEIHRRTCLYGPFSCTRRPTDAQECEAVLPLGHPRLSTPEVLCNCADVGFRCDWLHLETA